jgi:tRNA (cmo5U34)-methyltransferase
MRSDSDPIKEHFNDEAEEFDKLIWKLIPYYREMTDAVVSSIPFAIADRIRVLDLGCGTGNISRKIKDCFPHASITCVDFSEKMLTGARNKLPDSQDIRYINCDITDFGFEEPYDAVISSLAIHHLEDRFKKELFQRIYNALTDRGIFVNSDIVLGSADPIQAAFINKWKEYMRRNILPEEIENTWIPKYEREDRPALLTGQMKWLEEAGFNNIDVIWKYYNFAVYCGFK